MVRVWKSQGNRSRYDGITAVQAENYGTESKLKYIGILRVTLLEVAVCPSE